jgi:hypothetical protein
MKSSLRLAGATALCAALLLTACAKKTDQTTTSTQAAADAGVSSAPAAATSGSPDAAVSATPVAIVSASPDASASAAADSAASVPSMSVTTKSSNGASGGFIDLPVYPGAAESKEGAMSMSTNTGSFTVKVYTSKDDTKKVAEWYKSHLPGAFKGGILTAGDKTVGTFTDEHTDGDQSVIVAAADDHTTRIQLSTKHGK